MPAARPSRSAGRRPARLPLFVIQRHDARRLHYDLRLERNGALASWAVPKGLPFEPGQRHLAVHVEDHPLDYATFEGVIPAGQYGAGTVEIWDTGTVRAPRGEARRRSDVPARGRACRRRVDAGPGAARREGAELAPAPQGRLGAAASKLAAAARDAGGDGSRPARSGCSSRSGTGIARIVSVVGGEATLTSRNGIDLTERFRDVAARRGARGSLARRRSRR